MIYLVEEQKLGSGSQLNGPRVLRVRKPWKVTMDEKV